MSQQEVDFDQIGERVMVELNRRLGSPELAQDLPGTLLMKVAMDYVKYLEQRNAIEQAKLDAEKVDPIEMVNQPGLPLEMRWEIIDAYLDEVEDYWRRASVIREELEKEVRERYAEVLPEVQDVVSEG